MEYIQIPNLSLKSSRVGLGAWAIGGWMWGGTDEKRSIDTIHHALDLGINLIDTAPAYGFGLSEEIVGKALKEYGKRDQIIIATKTGLSWEEEQVFRDARREVLLAELDASLERLQVDYIDIYQMHWPDPHTSVAEIAETMHQFLKSGKIRSVGLSNFNVKMMKEFQKTTPLHVVQPPFNLFERQVEKDELAYCLKKGIATLGYGSLCRGLLSGKMHKDREFVGDDLRKVDPKFQHPHFASYLECTERLTQWAQDKYQRSLPALAVRWVLDKGISVALWGGRQPQQFDIVEDVWGWNLTKSDFKEIDTIIEKSIEKSLGPEFMAPPARKKVPL